MDVKCNRQYTVDCKLRSGAFAAIRKLRYLNVTRTVYCLVSGTADPLHAPQATTRAVQRTLHPPTEHTWPAGSQARPGHTPSPLWRPWGGPWRPPGQAPRHLVPSVAKSSRPAQLCWRRRAAHAAASCAHQVEPWQLRTTRAATRERAGKRHRRAAGSACITSGATGRAWLRRWRSHIVSDDERAVFCSLLRRVEEPRQRALRLLRLVVQAGLVPLLDLDHVLVARLVVGRLQHELGAVVRRHSTPQ